jgi:hypothetical protein
MMELMLMAKLRARGLMDRLDAEHQRHLDEFAFDVLMDGVSTCSRCEAFLNATANLEDYLGSNAEPTDG